MFALEWKMLCSPSSKNSYKAIATANGREWEENKQSFVQVVCLLIYFLYEAVIDYERPTCNMQ